MATQKLKYNVLMIEDDEDDALLIREMLVESKGSKFSVEHFDRLQTGLERLAKETFDIILLDLNLPDSSGIGTLERLLSEKPEVPAIVVLTGLDDETMGIRAVNIGAQDYLVKGFLESRFLTQSIRYAIERHNLHAQLKEAGELSRTVAQRWQTTFDSMNDIVFLVDSERKIMRANNVMAKFLGKPVSDIIGNDCYNVVHGSSCPPESCPFEQIRETRHRESGVLQMNDRWFNIIVDPILDDVGNVAGAVHVISDITERGRMEEQILWNARVSESLAELYKPLTSSSSMKEISNIILAHAQKLTGSKFGYVSSIDLVTGDNVSHTLTDMMVGDACRISGENKRIVFPKGIDGRYHGLWGHSLNTGESFFTNSPMAHLSSSGVPEGHISLERFLSVPVKLDEELVGQIALANPDRDYTNNDLNAIKRLAENYALAIQHTKMEELLITNEVRYRNVIALAGGVAYERDWENGVYTFMDEGIEKLTGYSSDEMTPKLFVDLVGEKPDKYDKKIIHSEASSQIGEGIFTLYKSEYNIRTKDGQIKYLTDSSLELRDNDNNIIQTLGMLQDITEHKIAEEQIKASENSLRKSEEVYRKLFNSTRESILTSSFDGKILSVNPAGALMLGYESPDELIGSNISELYKDPEQRANILAELSKKGYMEDQEIAFVKRDGTTTYTIASSFVRKDEEGNVLQFEGFFKDITERKQMEDELRKTNRALKALSECNQTLVHITDENELLHKICQIIVKEGGHRMAWIGFAEDDELKTVRPVAQAGYDEGYLKFVNITWGDVERGRGPTGTSIRIGKPTIARNILTDPNFGPWRADAITRGYASSVAIPLIVNGQPFGALVIYSAEPDAFDIPELELLTELTNDLAYGIISIRMRTQHNLMGYALEKSERKYRELVENLNDVIFAVDMEGNINYVTPSVEQVLGYTVDEILGKNFSQFVEPQDLPGLMLEFEQTLGGKLKPYEFRILDKAGKIHYGRSSSHPLFEDGKLTGLAGLLTDITSQKQLEEQLLQAQKMEAVGLLAGGIAHDFNNLIQVITGYSEFLLLKLGDKNSLSIYADEIRKAGEQAASLTGQLLAFSRKQVLRQQVVFINDLVNSMSVMLRRIIGEDIEFSAILSPDLLPVKADISQVEQVIMNIVVNAHDAIPEGGKLIIKTENVIINEAQSQHIPDSHPGNYVCLSISDTGIGMSEEVRQHIFEPFFSTKESKGTGLGLSVVYGIVKQHEGWINVHSEPGQGSVFTIYIPSISAKPEIVAQKQISPEEYDDNATRILLVEDEPQIREFVLNLLREVGYVVFEASRAKEAMDLFMREGGNFSLIFSDVVLPDLDGIQLIEQMRVLNPNIRVLLSSGYTGQKSQWDKIQNEEYPFIQKPYSITDLLRTIKNVIK
jgi:PAS domain S-box-containing protein